MDHGSKDGADPRQAHRDNYRMGDRRQIEKLGLQKRLDRAAEKSAASHRKITLHEYKFPLSSGRKLISPGNNRLVMRSVVPGSMAAGLLTSPASPTQPIQNNDAATTPAVSVLKRFLPNVTGTHRSIA